MFFRFHDLLWEVILGLTLHIQAWKLLILRNLQLRTFAEPWLHFKTRNRVCIKKSKHHFLHHQTLEVVFHDHIKRFKVVKILYFACVFSSPLSMFEMSQPVDRLSVWEKKQRGKGRESGKVGGEGGAFPSPQFHARPKDVLDIYSSPLMPTTPRGFLKAVVFKNTILQVGY